MLSNRLTIGLLALVSLTLFLLNLNYSPAPTVQQSSAPVAAPTIEAPEFTLHIPPITNLAAPDVGNICDLPEFAGSVRLNVTIFVFAWRRLTSLRRLLDSLESSEYCTFTVPLVIFVDGGSSVGVREFVRGFHWPHGPKRITLYDELGLTLGIRGMWINASDSVGGLTDAQHILPLEDDIEVSPLYFWWLLRAARSYGPLDNAEVLRERRLLGISLYTPRLNEIRYPQAKWLPDQHTRSPTLLLQVPCSWGALFLGSMWRDFLGFYHLRVRPPFFNFSQEATQRGVGKLREALGDPHVRLPSSRSNVWPRSWKRFMVDFMYGRGLVMMYPNLAKQRSFSTTYMERGGHSGKDGKAEALQVTGTRKDIDPLKTVPLVLRNELNQVVQSFSELAAFEVLPVFDLQHQQRPREALVQQGFAFTESVRWWGVQRAATERHPALLSRYSALASYWSGVALPAGGGGGCVMEQLMSRAPKREHAAWQRADAQLPPDLALPRSSKAPADDGTRSFLVYQPPSGLGEWLISLRNAVGIARALGRTLVVPHLLWDGSVSTPVPFSSIFDFSRLQQSLAGVIEMEQFLHLDLRPERLVMLHVKDPHTRPARSYFDAVAGWFNVSATHMPAQMCRAADYIRLYGGCSGRVLALSHVYAAFEGFEAGSEAEQWFQELMPHSLLADLPTVETKLARITQRLRVETGTFTCVHLTELDSAVINSRTPLTPDQNSAPATPIDVAEPAAHSVPFATASASFLPYTLRQPSTACDGFDAEGQHPAGRAWVKAQLEQGLACHVTDGVIVANLARMPPRDTVFVLADGERVLSEELAERASATLRSEFMHAGDVVALLGLDVRTSEWPALEQAVCAEASTLLLNAYSPLSAILAQRAHAAARHGGRPAPSFHYWSRIDSDHCLPLFTRTARFDIQPNRFGILGQAVCGGLWVDVGWPAVKVAGGCSRFMFPWAE